MPLVPTALLGDDFKDPYPVKEEIAKLTKQYGTLPMANYIVELVEKSTGVKIDYQKVENELRSNMNMKESTHVTRSQIRRIIKEELSRYNLR